ncbi:phosphatidylinositol alpha 1,6-mannosyltransferase [Nocardioides scoriae]|uniref:Phosphatidylinositol alpha 1,6-mannosyltransferase n=1 Tax=Nocardioides scoriae TaxID=642780 RepID=A0A1H1YIJ0_9ACTN|nr:phosphatidylinositol alpha 1,6-mannosyltransferase [Nocardioides scoriae]
MRLLAPRRPAAVRTGQRLRVVVVTESFLPQVNGVTNSVRRVLEHLQAEGHEAVVVAPSGPAEYAGAPVHLVRSLAMPTYRDFPVGVARRGHLRQLLADLAPDVVHLASPAWLGHQAGEAARSLGIPVVAVYQTDLVGFAERYPFPGAAAAMRTLTRWVHGPADRTLVPSTASLQQLQGLGIERLHRWGRGVDTTLFAPHRRTEQLRRELGLEGGRGPLLVGYVGRLAAEKELDLLAGVQAMPGVRLVVVGGGPEEARLRRLLPGASFLGVRHGEDLARIVASLDVFVHTGSTETFCQSAQEALASGVPVVAPRAGGPVDLVRHAGNGFLFAPGDAHALAGHVAALCGDPLLRRRLAAAARPSVRHRSWAAVNAELVAHYRAVTGVVAQVPHSA